jgi:tetratricopeptide (TPR) repeat protein
MLNRNYLILIFLLAILQSACQSIAPTQTEPAQPVEQPPEVVEADPRPELYDLAITTAKEGQTNESIDFFRQLIDIDNEYKHAHTNLGLQLFNKKDYKLAQSEFLIAIEQDKKDAIAYNHLAIMERQQGLFEQAKQHYLLALEINPEYANAHLNLGILLDIYLQQWDKALAHYQKYQELTGAKDENVEKWIADLQRRIDKKTKDKS